MDDYLDFARTYITRCEERHGVGEVERVLDSAHALMANGVFRYRRPPRLSLREEKERRLERLAHEEKTINYLWSTLPGMAPKTAQNELIERKRKSSAAAQKALQPA